MATGRPTLRAGLNLVVTPEAAEQRGSRVRWGSRRVLRPARARLRRADYWALVGYGPWRLPMPRCLGSPGRWLSRPDHRLYERPGRGPCARR
jgi:hypothetical protein